METLIGPIEALPLPPALLGESPVWHPDAAELWWVDIAGRRLHAWHPASAQARQWDLPGEPGCCAPLPDGQWLLALREGLHRFDPGHGLRARLHKAPYDTAQQRFNDGRADARGRLWVGTIHEPRQPALAALYRYADGELQRMADGITTSNGLAFSPDGATMYWADTRAHAIDAFDFDADDGSLSARRRFATFEPRREGQPLQNYGGRPDGAAVDVQGCYWVAMYEGARVLRLSPAGQVLAELRLPVRCPTMPCFGDADLRTLYITTARHGRPADELAREPLAGCVLRVRVGVTGLPANFAQLG